MCFDDGSAEVILTDILEPVTVSWHNTATDDYYEGMNPTTLKDGGYTVTVIDPDGLEYIKIGIEAGIQIDNFESFVFKKR